MASKLRSIQAAMAVLRVRDETFKSYDEMIGDGNADVNATVHAAIDGLTAQNAIIEQGLLGVIQDDALAAQWYSRKSPM